jgi:hypothetical protein
MALRGVALVSHLITCDVIEQQWVILLLVHTQACHVPLMMETLLGA